MSIRVSGVGRFIRLIRVFLVVLVIRIFSVKLLSAGDRDYGYRRF